MIATDLADRSGGRSHARPVGLLHAGFCGCDLTDTAFGGVGHYSGFNWASLHVQRAIRKKEHDAMIVKYLRLAIILLVGLQLAGCYTDYGPVEVGVAPFATSAAGAASV